MPFSKPIPDDGRIAAVLQETAKRWAPRSVLDVELLTVREVAGILRIAVRQAYTFVHTLPPGAIVRVGSKHSNLPTDSRRILVHAWALGQTLNLENCPGCGQAWPPRS